MYGDSYLTAPFAPVLAAFLSSSKPAMMTVFANENGAERSNVILSGNAIIRYDKHSDKAQMTHIDYGLGLFRAEVFRRWPGSATFDLSLLQSRLAEQDMLAACEVAERYYEIGSISGLKETDAFLRSHDLIKRAPGRKAGRAARVHGAPA
jgi:hypothetical protein